MKHAAVILGLLLFLTFTAATVVNAQNPVSLSLSVSPGSISAGGKGTAKISASIGAGWHMYSVTQGSGGPVPTRITFGEGPFTMNGVSGPAPKVALDPNFGIKTETYSGGATFNAPFTLAADTVPGPQTLTVNVRYQVCNDTTCLPPKTVKSWEYT